MKKQLFALLIWVVSNSCAQKPDLKEIQLTVFGNLPMGVNHIEYKKQFPKIVKNSMSITGTSKYPFFKLEKRDLLEYRLTLLYPHTFVNKDSIVTKIVFYLYDVAFPSKEVVETANENPEQREIFARSLDYKQKKFDFLTQNFDTKRNIDSQFLLYLPNIAQGDDYNSLEKTISDNLTSKYGKSSNIMTGGNEYNPNDNSFFKVQIWKTDKLNIKLVRKRYPVVNPQTSRNFYMVLIYEYNEEIRDKYKLKSETNLANTF